jgi:hypothetical protein
MKRRDGGECCEAARWMAGKGIEAFWEALETTHHAALFHRGAF